MYITFSYFATAAHKQLLFFRNWAASLLQPGSSFCESTWQHGMIAGRWCSSALSTEGACSITHTLPMLRGLYCITTTYLHHISKPHSASSSHIYYAFAPWNTTSTAKRTWRAFGNTSRKMYPVFSAEQQVRVHTIHVPVTVVSFLLTLFAAPLSN